MKKVIFTFICFSSLIAEPANVYVDNNLVYFETDSHVFYTPILYHDDYECKCGKTTYQILIESHELPSPETLPRLQCLPMQPAILQKMFEGR